MKKKLEEKIVYEPNETVKVTVSNKPELDGEVTRYKRKVSIVVDLGYDKDKLSFSSNDEIAKFLENIDVEDPQQSLL